MLTFMFSPVIYLELIFCVLRGGEVEVYFFLHRHPVVTAPIIGKTFIPTGLLW